MITYLITFLTLQHYMYVLAYMCPDKLRHTCTCYTTSGGIVRRIEYVHVDCSSKELKSVPDMGFHEGARIHELYLQNNSLTTLLSNGYTWNVRVTYLDISKNPISSSLETLMLKYFVSGLKVLIARDIGLDLQNFTSLAFLKGVHTLTELDLSGNMEYGVEKLPAIFVENDLKSLKILHLSLCRIKDINVHAFIGLNSLTEIDLSRNYLTRVPRALSRLPNLKKLNLSENDIRAIYHGDFTDLAGLEELDLSKNTFSKRDSFRNGALFGLENSLRQLFLHGTKMSVIPTRSLSELKRLTHLDISRNNMKSMQNSSFRGKYKLEFLDISDNSWFFKDDMFSNFKDSLLTLRMRNVDLPYLPRVPLAMLKRLRNLDASNNNIIYINNDTLAGISARRLSFRGNKVRFVTPDAFRHYKRPLDLDLSDNVLDSLNFIFESDKCTFYKLNITNNGFLCDCQIERTINSNIVHDLIGDCFLKEGLAVSLTNKSMVANIEKKCGKSEPTFCFWWLPKSTANVFYISSLHMIVLILFTLSWCV
ncbi:volume-sensitive anion channel [Mactra antiquata]